MTDDCDGGKTQRLSDKLFNRIRNKGSPHGLRINDDAGLLELRKSSRLFCAYLTLNARGWQRLKTQRGSGQDGRKRHVILHKVSNLLGTAERECRSFTPSQGSPLTTDETESVRGFEVVWLAERDQISALARDWAADESSMNVERASMSIWTIAVSADNRYVACGSSEGLIFVWLLRDGLPDPLSGKCNMLERVTTLSGHTGGVMRCQWSRNTDTRVLLSCGFDGAVRLWSVHPTPEMLCILKCPEVPVGVTFTQPDWDSRAIVTCLDGATRVISFSPSPSEAVRTTGSKPALINCKVEATVTGNHAATHMSVSSDGRVLAVGSPHGIVTLHELEQYQIIRRIECKNHSGKFKGGEKITGISWDSSSRFIAVTSRDGRIRIVDILDPRRNLKLKAASDPILVAAFDSNDRFVISIGGEGQVYIWDLLRASSNDIHRRRGKISRQHSTGDLSLMVSPTAPLLANVEPLEDEFKRESAFPIAQFNSGLLGVITAMAVIPFPDPSLENVRAIRILLGSESGSFAIFVALLSE